MIQENGHFPQCPVARGLNSVGDTPRHDYVLTQAGRDFLPVLMMLGAWAQRNCGDGLARYIDGTTGLEIQPVGVDAVSGARLGSRPIRMREG